MQAQSVGNEPRADLPRTLGRLSLLAFACNAVVGTGIIGVSAQAGAALGRWTILALLSATAVSAIIAICFHALASRFDGPGGPYDYVERALGRDFGYHVGWLYYAARPLSAAATLALAVDLIHPPWGDLGRVLAIAGIGAVFAGVALIGIRTSAAINGVMTACKIALFLFLIVWLVRNPQAGQGLSQAAWTPPAFSESVILFIYCYAGFESLSVLAGDARRPRADIPWAMAGGLLVAAAIYIPLTLYGPIERERLPPAWLGAIELVLFAGLLSQFVGPPRMLLALSRSQHLPAGLGDLKGSQATPRNAILLGALGIIAVACVLDFTRLAVASTVLRLIVYLACCVSLMVLSTRERGFEDKALVTRAKGLAGTTVSLSLLVMSGVQEFMLVFGVVLLGALLRVITRRRVWKIV